MSELLAGWPNRVEWRRDGAKDCLIYASACWPAASWLASKGAKERAQLVPQSQDARVEGN